MKPAAFVVVDGGSTGRFYAPALRAHGYDCIHVQSSLQMAPIFEQTFSPHDYLENVVVDDAIEAAIARVSGYQVCGVLAGSDSGLEIADTIATRLALSNANTLDGSAERRDKFLMHEALRRAGMASVRQARVDSVSRAADFAQRIGFPAVVKPVQSAGTDRVRVCLDAASVEQAVRDVLELPNIFRRANEAAVVQQYIEGHEFMIDTQSMHGQTRTIAIWRVDRAEGAAPFPLQAITLRDGPEADLLRGYASSVCDTLRHRFGPAHIEVRLGSRGPMLIELNARLHGRLDPGLMVKATGASQPELAVKCLIDEKRFAELAGDFSGHRGQAMKVHLASPRAGVVSREPDESPIRSLCSFHSMISKLHLGTRVARTESLTTVVGTVFLYHRSADQLQADCEAIRRLERAGLYDCIGDGAQA